MMTKTTEIPTCRIVVINDVLETKSEVVSPQSVADATNNHGAVCLALRWLDFHYSDNLDIMKLLDPQPIGVALHRTDDTITVHWYVDHDADPDVARTAMKAVLNGSWREGETV